MAPMFKVVFGGEDGHNAPEDDKATADPSGHAHVYERPAKDWKMRVLWKYTMEEVSWSKKWILFFQGPSMITMSKASKIPS